MEDLHKDTSERNTADRGGAPIDRGGAPIDRSGAPIDRGGAPIDRGWAWMVVLALVLVNLVMPIMSVRKLTTISCIVYSVANWAVVVTPNLPVFFVVCVIKYTAQGGVLVPPLTLVGHYFERRRALATSLSLLGISVASITVPPLTRYIRNEYGFRGCFLLLSAYEMQAIAAAMLLRPLSSCSMKLKTNAQHSPTRGQVNVDTHDLEQQVMVLESTCKTTQQSTIGNTHHFCESAKVLQAETSTSDVELTKQDVKLVTGELEDDCLTMAGKGEMKDDLLCVVNGRLPDIKHSLNGAMSNINTDTSQTDDIVLLSSSISHKQIDEKRSLIGDSSLECTEENFSQIKLTELKEFSLCQSREDHSECHLGTDQGSRKEANFLKMDDRNKQKNNQIARPSASFCDEESSFHLDKTSFRHVETNFTSKKYVTDQAELDALIRSNNDVNIVCAKTTAEKSFFAQSLKVLQSALDFSLLRNYLAILYLFTFGLHHSSVFLATYVPSYAIKVGLSQQNAAILLTIVGTCDGVSRVAYGYFADLRLVRPSLVLAGLYMFLGVVCQFTSQFTSLEGLVFLAVSYGCCGLSHLSLNAPLIVDLLGVEHLGKIFALGALTSSVFISVQFPLHGLLIGATGRFVASFHWIGATFMLSSLCLLSEPVVRRLEGQRKRSC